MIRKIIILIILLTVFCAAVISWAEFSVSGVDNPASVSGVDNPVSVCGVIGGSSCVSEATVLGYSSLGASNSGIQNAIYCTRFQAYCSGPVDELRYIAVSQGAGEGATLGIYADNAGEMVTTSVLRDTGEVFGTGASNETIIAALDTSYTMTDGAWYWLCISSDDTVFISRDTGADGCRNTEDITYVAGTMPTNFTCYEYDYEHSIWGLAQ